MLIPLTTSRAQRSTPVVTWLLVGFNLLVFILGTGVEQTDPRAFERFMAKAALDPVAIGMGGREGAAIRTTAPGGGGGADLRSIDLENPEEVTRAIDRVRLILAGRARSEHGNWGWWGVLTYQFLHGGFMHILGNMLFLWVFGPPIEDRLGKVGFLLFYLLGGVLAGLTHAAFEPNPVIGASGSIAAVTGAFLVLFPRVHVKLFSFFIVVGVFEIPAWIFIVMAVIRDLWGVGTGGEGVAFLAHLGGYLMGFSVAMAGLLSRLIPEEEWSLLSTFRRQKRRVEFKAQMGQAEKIIKSRSAKLEKGGGVQERLLWQRVEREPAEGVAEDPAVVSARGKVLAALSKGDAGQEEAVEGYRVLRRLAAERGTPPLPAKAQAEVANLLMMGGQHAEAADAYQAALDAEKGGGDATRLRLMLALVAQRYLNQPDRAREALSGLPKHLHDAQLDGLARSLREEAGAGPS